MTSKNLKTNIYYSSLLTVFNYIVPLITYPYVSRVLGVEKIGLCNFIDSIINYFILFSTMGIVTVGVREIAACRDNQKLLNSTFSSLIALCSVTTLFSVVILIVAIFLVPILRLNADLMIIGCFKLIFNLFLIEWFYKGIEDFRYITLRSLVVRILYIISVFVFVKSSSDYWIYYMISCGMIVLNSIINYLHSRKFVLFSLSTINIRPIIKPFFIFGGFYLLTSMYTTFNISYLGFVTNDTEVGYYTTATKLYTIILGFFTAFTGVLLPRMTALITEGHLEEFLQKIMSSLEILIALSIPIIIYIEILAPQVIFAISGPGYEGAIIPMRIVMPLLLIIGLNQIMVLQILTPMKMDKIIICNSAITAFVGIMLNIILVKHFGSIGSAIVWCGSEIVLLMLSFKATSRYVHLELPFRKLGLTILLYAMVAIALILITYPFSHWFLKLMIGAFIVFTMFLIINMTIMKDGYIGKFILSNLFHKS